MPVQTPTNDQVPEPSLAVSSGAVSSGAATNDGHVRQSPSFVQQNLGLMIGAFGFAAGCVFWHYVGFWALINAMFYSGSSVDRVADLQIQPQPQSKPDVAKASAQANLRTTVGLLNVTLTAQNCTSLMLDRTTAVMLSEPCTPEVMQLNSLRAARKEDRRLSIDEAKAATVRAKFTTAPTAAPAVASWSSKVVATPTN